MTWVHWQDFVSFLPKKDIVTMEMKQNGWQVLRCDAWPSV
jgi:hypothetical protein